MAALHEGKYLTLTFVVRADNPAGMEANADSWQDDPRSLLDDDSVMFWGSEPGITEQALELGADPSMWHDDECDRCGGPWGEDETCPRCTFEDGTPRPVGEPGPLGPGRED